MSQTLYATFNDANQAEKAVGALLDFGAEKGDISVVANSQGHLASEYDGPDDKDEKSEPAITTTTAADAESGAVKGAGVGLGLGVLAGLAVLTIPGFGLVLGGGALASAIAAAGAATAAGAIAGGVTGYLKDQGLPPDAVRTFTDKLAVGGTLLAVTLPSGTVDSVAAQEIISKYDGADVGLY
jgi:hypothetical protein